MFSAAAEFDLYPTGRYNAGIEFVGRTNRVFFFLSLIGGI